MISFLSALQFLTIIPVKIKHVNEKQISEAMIYFPLVGLLLGLILAVSDNLFYFLNLGAFATNTILVILLAALTGGMHLDGLADTADAFFSGKNREEMLEIMRDSHIGVMGVLGLISVILLKIVLLSSLGMELKTTSLFLMCILSRWSAVLAIFFFPYARQDGKAGIFIRGMNLKIFILSLIAVILCASLIWGIKGLIALLIVAASSYAIGKFAAKKIGGITGDTLGAIIELMEIVILLTGCIAGGLIYG